MLFRRGVKYVFLALFPITLLLVTLAHECLALWLGSEFAQNSTRVLQYLAVGVFINALSLVPFTLIQGVGRPDLTAKLLLIEMPLYLLGLWWLVGSYGINGAAVAWVARALLDGLLTFGMSQWLSPTNASLVRRAALTAGVTLLIMAFAIQLAGIILKGLFLALVLLMFALAAWFLLLTPEERALVQHYTNINKILLRG
jgi:O-antigen/teichoic acid export membrane protein